MYCMVHAHMIWKIWNDMLCSKMLDQSWLIIKTCTKLLKIRKKETHLNLNLIFHFFFNIFTFRSSHTISILLYWNKYFSKKKTLSLFFDHFQHGIFFSTTFIPDRIIFLFNIPKYIFSKKMNKTLTFNFFQFFIANKISSYFFTKKQNWKLLFFAFFL